MNLVRRGSVLAALVVGSMTCAGATENAPLHLVHTVPLPQVSGRFDHFAIDPVGRRLFVAALGNDSVEIIDLADFKRAPGVRGLHKPTGVAFLAERGQVVVANGDDGSLRAFDATSLAPMTQLTDLDDADNVRVDPDARRLYVGFGDGAIGTTDFQLTKLADRMVFKGHPESFQLERNGKRLFVNIPDAHTIAVLDRETGAVMDQWPMDRFQANYPMSLDESGRRLFVGCRRPARLVIFDIGTGKPVGDLAISGDTDDLFFDAKRQRLYVSCGEGFIDVVQRRNSDQYERIARVPTRTGARTSFFSSELDQLYVAVPERAGHAAEIQIYQPN
jgi:hypothetical protein